jgi:hypothetical protein
VKEDINAHCNSVCYETPLRHNTSIQRFETACFCWQDKGKPANRVCRQIRLIFRLNSCHRSFAAVAVRQHCLGAKVVCVQVTRQDTGCKFGPQIAVFWWMFIGMSEECFVSLEMETHVPWYSHVLNPLPWELQILWRMASSGMLRRVALVRTEVSEEPSASFIRVTGIGEVRTLAVTSKRRTLRASVASYG